MSNDILNLSGFFICDNLGGFDGELFLSKSMQDGSTIWDYWSSRCANSFHTNIETAKKQIAKLQELNSVAGIKDLTWEIKFANLKEMPHGNLNTLLIEKTIPWGMVGKHRKLVKEINEKYELTGKF
jgi:hypothetical protein